MSNDGAIRVTLKHVEQAFFDDFEAARAIDPQAFTWTTLTGVAPSGDAKLCLTFEITTQLVEELIAQEEPVTELLEERIGRLSGTIVEAHQTQKTLEALPWTSSRFSLPPRCIELELDATTINELVTMDLGLQFAKLQQRGDRWLVRLTFTPDAFHTLRPTIDKLAGSSSACDNELRLLMWCYRARLDEGSSGQSVF